MQTLPIGIQSFEKLRRENLLYVDKTGKLLEMIRSGSRYFLSRPRRFGKSLTLSTLEAMFKGQSKLFRGLSAEDWVGKQAQNPAPVLRLDMSIFTTETIDDFKLSLKENISRLARLFKIEIFSETIGGKFQDLIEGLYSNGGSVVVLIDEYDKPILDHINDLRKANEIREVLRSFYIILKSCDKYLRFVMLTGISKFSKVGIFSTLNNLQDISMARQYSDIVGYTQEELEKFFSEWICKVADDLNISSEELLIKMKNYYDGFSFDGQVRLYNPFSILNFLSIEDFRNYWYDSGSPSFIVEWMKAHSIQVPEEYRHIEVFSDFLSSQEIERAKPASFLYQSGYLTIEKKEEQILTLDYPNREVLDSISRLYLELVYHVEQFASLGSAIWRALRDSNISEIVRLYNTALKEVSYGDFSNRDEFWYRSLFLMLLRGAGIIAYAEVQTFKGRSDVTINFKNQVIVLEFKFAKKSSQLKEKILEGQNQLKEREYAGSYKFEDRKVIEAVIVADDEQRQAVFSSLIV